MIITNYYILDDLKNYAIDHLLYKSENKVVDDFIRDTQINNLMDMMEFVPYDQFKDIESEEKFSKAYKATWIDGNIQSWGRKTIDFKRNGPMQVILKRLNNSENITSMEILNFLLKIQLNIKTKHHIFGINKCYGITQDPVSKNFIIVMNNYPLDDLIDNLLYKSGNKVVDDFIRHTLINSNLEARIMEFVPYDQFKDIEFIAEGGFSEIYRATWIGGNIQKWNKKEINFKRSDAITVVLKRLINSKNITSKELNEVQYIYFNCNIS